MPLWTCAECDNDDNAAEDVCDACGEPRAAVPAADSSPLAGFVVGLVLSCEGVPGKDRLKLLSVDIGRAAPVPIVTNAPNISASGVRLVIATIGARVGDVVVKRTSVGGVQSEGIVADSPMLGWTGGGAGNAALLPDSCAVGSAPPSTRPRLK